MRILLKGWLRVRDNERPYLFPLGRPEVHPCDLSGNRFMPDSLQDMQGQQAELQDLQRLFPFGYQRGACKLAGLSFMAGGVSTPFYPTPETPIGPIPIDKRVYRVNVQGFLIDPNEWDEDFAIFKARELQMAGPLGEKHWQIIRYMRSEFEKKDEIPTVYATCEAVGIDMDELEELFPSGYHRGAVKIAGLNLAAKRH